MSRQYYARFDNIFDSCFPKININAFEQQCVNLAVFGIGGSGYVFQELQLSRVLGSEDEYKKNCKNILKNWQRVFEKFSENNTLQTMDDVDKVVVNILRTLFKCGTKFKLRCREVVSFRGLVVDLNLVPNTNVLAKTMQASSLDFHVAVCDFAIEKWHTWYHFWKGKKLLLIEYRIMPSAAIIPAREYTEEKKEQEILIPAGNLFSVINYMTGDVNMLWEKFAELDETFGWHPSSICSNYFEKWPHISNGKLKYKYVDATIPEYDQNDKRTGKHIKVEDLFSSWVVDYYIVKVE